MVEQTDIRISKALRSRLRELGHKGDTYETIISTYLPKEKKNVIEDEKHRVFKQTL
jgi:hypothetical protein